MFGTFHKLEDNCVIKPWGKYDNNFLLVLGVDILDAKLNQELNKKKKIEDLKYSYVEIQKYRCFTKREIQSIMKTTPDVFSSYVQQ